MLKVCILQTRAFNTFNTLYSLWIMKCAVHTPKVLDTTEPPSGATSSSWSDSKAFQTCGILTKLWSPRHAGTTLTSIKRNHWHLTPTHLAQKRNLRYNDRCNTCYTSASVPCPERVSGPDEFSPVIAASGRCVMRARTNEALFRKCLVYCDNVLVVLIL